MNGNNGAERSRNKVYNSDSRSVSKSSSNSGSYLKSPKHRSRSGSYVKSPKNRSDSSRKSDKRGRKSFNERKRYSSSRSRSSRKRSYSPSPNRYNKRYSRSRSPSRNKKRFGVNRENPSPSSCIGVFGLSRRTDEHDLKNFFSEFGRIQSINIVMDRHSSQSLGYGFIYFYDEDSATRAKEEGSGAEIDGRKIRIDYSITKKAHTPTPGKYLGKKSRRGDYESRDDSRENRFNKGRFRDFDRRRSSRSPAPRRRRSRSRSRSFEATYRRSHR